MKYILATLLLQLLFISNFTLAQNPIDLKKTRNEETGMAYGFIIGQEYSLEKIEKEFPNHKFDVMYARMNFNSVFGKAKGKMINYFSDFTGKENFEKFNNDLKIEMKEVMDSQVFTEDLVINFIAEVNDRAKGNIPSPILEIILSYQYDNPSEEFLKGFVNVFRTKGHIKSKNTDWQIKIPKSWRAEEGERPNIIQKFISDYGHGNQNIIMMVKELPKNYQITEKDIYELFDEEEMKDLVPEGSSFISASRMKLDKHDGGMLVCEIINERLDFKLKMRTVQFMFIRNNKLYTFSGMTSSEDLKADLSKEMSKYMTLFKLVANSLVVNEQY